VEQLHEFNPMLGHRGCRLGITYPEITEMQARAIFEAAVKVAKEGVKVLPEVMIPLVATVKEMANQAAMVRASPKKFSRRRAEVEYMVGTMIELPRAALVADEIAKEAEFFSFGTNDLTQTTFGFSRDDVNKILPTYLAEGILKQDPFAALDREGVGQLVKMALNGPRKTRPNLKVGICGEHGGEPSSVEFCYQTGLNYVSCSPFRVLTARGCAAAAGRLMLDGRLRPRLFPGKPPDESAVRRWSARSTTPAERQRNSLRPASRKMEVGATRSPFGSKSPAHRNWETTDSNKANRPCGYSKSLAVRLDDEFAARLRGRLGRTIRGIDRTNCAGQF
jgi:hypothetical protein